VSWSAARGQPVVEGGDDGAALALGGGCGLDAEFHSEGAVGVDSLRLLLAVHKARALRQVGVEVRGDAENDLRDFLGDLRQEAFDLLAAA
jgi:hypothetical protein